MFVDDTLVINPLAACKYPLAVRFVDDTAPNVACPAFAWKVPPIVTLPEDDAEVNVRSFRTDDAFMVRRFVELAKVKESDDVAPPPSWPKRICVSTPAVNDALVEVEYLFPLKSNRFVMVAVVAEALTVLILVAALRFVVETFTAFT